MVLVGYPDFFFLPSFCSIAHVELASTGCGQNDGTTSRMVPLPVQGFWYVNQHTHCAYLGRLTAIETRSSPLQCFQAGLPPVYLF